MIKVGETNKLPAKAGWYKILKLVLPLLLLSTPLIFLWSFTVWFSFFWVAVLILVLPMSIWILLDTKANTFTVDKNKIEVNWGIILKKSRTIMIKAIQNVKIEKGILASMCGVWIVSIWTSSPSQDRNGKEESNHPDGLLILAKDDAHWLNEFIAGNK